MADSVGGTVALSILGAAIALEFGAVALPGQGLVSLAPVVYLTAALVLGPVPALVIASLALLARMLLKSEGVWSGRLRETLSDLVVLILTLFSYHQLPPSGLTLLLLYLPLRLVLPPLLLKVEPGLKGPWRESRSRLLGPHLFALSLVPLLATTPQSVLLISLLVALAGFQFALRQAPRSLKEESQEQLNSSLDQTKERLAQQAESLREARQALHQKLDEATLLGRLARGFSQARSLGRVCEVVIDHVPAVAPEVTSAVVFLLEDGIPEPCHFFSPRSEVLKNFRLLQV